MNIKGASGIEFGFSLSVTVSGPVNGRGTGLVRVVDLSLGDLGQGRQSYGPVHLPWKFNFQGVGRSRVYNHLGRPRGPWSSEKV